MFRINFRDRVFRNSMLFLLVCLTGISSHAQRPKPEIPLRIKSPENSCRPDSLDCTIWLGLIMPFRIKDSVLANPYFSSRDLEIIFEKGEFFPAAEYELKDFPVSVDLYNIKGQDTIKVRTFNFTMKTVPNPDFSVAGKVVKDSISKSALLDARQFDVSTNCPLDSFQVWQLNSFDMEIDGKAFSSPSNKITPEMRRALKDSKSGKVRISNERVVMADLETIPRIISDDNTYRLVR